MARNALEFFSLVQKESRRISNIYYVDLINYGSSPFLDTMSIPELAGDIRRLLRTLAQPKYILIGRCLGALVLSSVLSNYPDLHSSIERLILIDDSPVN